MCLYLKDSNKQVAEEDILVFKVLYLTATKKVISYFYLKEYKKDELNTSKIIQIFLSESVFIIETALHSYSLDCHCELVCGKYLKVGLEDICQTYSDDAVIGLFKIPKGSEYYLYNNCYASNQIVYLGEYYNISTWLKVKERLKDKIKDYVSSI